MNLFWRRAVRFAKTCPNMHALTLLGTAPGAPAPGRGHSSALLESGGCRLLVDAGEPCSRRLRELGVPIDSLDAVLISHGHSDHTAGLMMLLQGAWLEGRKRALPIYLPGELIAPLRGWLDAVYLPEKLIGFALEWRPWETAEQPALLGHTVRVTVSSTTHLDGLRDQIEPGNLRRFLAYSLAFDLGERRLVCSADLGAPSDLDAMLAAPCDVLICELAHFEPEALFAYLQGKRIGRLFLTHLTNRFLGEIARIEALAAEMLPALPPVTVLADGERVEF